MAQLTKKIKINTTITLLTGLHVGGSTDNVEIGGIDNPVIKIASKDNQPYIPGSSIKGKMRCLLEQMAGSAKVGGDPIINNLFGSADAKNPLPSRIIVRDAMLDEKSAEYLKNCENLDMPYTESKYENIIDRVKGTAEHPRQTERVPAGAFFNVEFIINIWDNKEKELLDTFSKGINALENDYLGGSGSRGYGQIRFSDWKFFAADETSEWKMNKVEDLITW